MLELTILGLTLFWLISFFDRSLVPGIPHNARLTDTLAVAIVLLIAFRFLT
ncbi:MAG: hypothetical protein ACM3Y8_09915 [Byssovorax cruenta]